MDLIDRNYKRPENIHDFPVGTYYKAGHLVTDNASFRVKKPSVDNEKCIFCYRCYLLCPDGAISKNEHGIIINYDFCKGCGICANVCHKNCIKMVKEDSL